MGTFLPAHGCIREPGGGEWQMASQMAEDTALLVQVLSGGCHGGGGSDEGLMELSDWLKS